MAMVVVTASAFEVNRQESAEAGADDFLAKPFREQKLLDIVNTHLDLEWVYSVDATDAKEESEAVPVEAEEIVPPADGELADLMAMAMAGNMIGLRERTETLMQADPQFAAFAQHVIQLTKEFKVDEIQDFIRPLVEAPGKGS